MSPLLFSYGTLREEPVQRATFGRRLDGRADELPGFAPDLVGIDDPAVVAALGRTHHANARATGDPASRVPGMVFEVTDDELARADAFEAPYRYERILVTLGSGSRAWVYVDASAAGGPR